MRSLLLAVLVLLSSSSAFAAQPSPPPPPPPPSPSPPPSPLPRPPPPPTKEGAKKDYYLSDDDESYNPYMLVAGYGTSHSGIERGAHLHDVTAHVPLWIPRPPHQAHPLHPQHKTFYALTP